MHLELVEQRPSRKGKEREPISRDNMVMREPQPTDLDEKLTALRRRTAAATRPRDKSERERLPQQPPQPTNSTPRIDRSPKTASMARQPPVSPRRHQAPHVLLSRPSQEADHEEFSRKLKISTSPPPRHTPAVHYKPSPKLFDPDNDPIPNRWATESESMSDAAGGSGVRGDHGSGRDHRANTPRQLFDHRKDDPVRFSVLARPPVSGGGRPTPTPKMSGDHVSASSTSSYAASISSSNFTLSSTTDGSSSSSMLFEGWQNHGQGTDDSGNNVFSIQLKKLYRALSNLETKIKQEDPDDAEDGVANRVMLKGKEIEPAEVEREKWKKLINDHKELAEIGHNLLEISLSPSVPASLRNIPTKYNIIVRLWTYGFHKLLECLRRASFTSPLALEHLQDFIYYAYTFYTGLLEEPTLNPFKSGWLEALGDLARYRIAVAAMVNGGVGGQGGLTTQAVSEASMSNEVNSKSAEKKSSTGSVGSSDFPAARIDDSPSPSIGVAAARLLDVEPEKERWRNIARDWYGAGLAEQPGTGKLHHHLGLLSREVEGEELRGIYHFVKSMTTIHPFSTSRESVLPIWSQAAQARRSSPDARASELFVLLHGMLFTNIQLDDFQPTLARFVERLEIEGVEEREWIMMAVINVTSVLEYGRPNGVLRRLGCFGSKDGPQAAAMRVMAKKAAAGVPGSVRPCHGNPGEESMDVDDEHHQKGFDRDQDIAMRSPVVSTAVPDPDLLDLPPAFKFALQLTFAVLSHVLKKPTRKASQYSRSTLNPYLTVLLTFLATVLKHRPSLGVLERSIPWADLTAFFTTVPRKIMTSQGLMYSPHDRHYSSTRGNTTNHNGSPSESLSNKGTVGTSAPASERWVMLTSGCAPPLPEDWCMRGMEWVGRKVFERGYWKSGEEKTAELEVLQTTEGGEVTDGKIEDDDGEEGGGKRAEAVAPSDFVRRWLRVVRCGVHIADIVDGFNWVDGTREWNIEGKLAEKVKRWKEEDRIEKEEEERRRLGRRWVDDVMDVDEEDEIVSEDSGDDENDSEEIKGLKARRRYLKSLLLSTQRASTASHQRRAPRAPKKPAESKCSLTLIPGYTILVIDTNILLSSLSIITSLIESQKWTIVIPLPVIMELDGLSSNTEIPHLSDAAQIAMSYISSHIRSHSLSLKVQTSKGNYLSSLAVRTEEVDFDSGDGKRLASKSMDDLILKAAIWQDDHWVNRSSLLKATSPSSGEVQNGTKVVLLTLDRNLRLKARSRQLPAGGEKDLNSLLSLAS